MVAPPVAVLRTVKDRRRRVADEEVDALVADLDRQVPVALGGETKGGARLLVMEAFGDEVARHVGPAELLEGARPLGVDRVLAVDDHAVLPRELAEAEGIVRAAHGAVRVEVLTGGDARVARGDVAVGVLDGVRAALPDLEVVVPEEVRGLRRVVELVDEEHVGVDALDRLGDVAGLLVGAVSEVLLELALRRTVEGGVEGREAHPVVGLLPRAGTILCEGGRRGGQREGERCGERCGEPKGARGGGSGAASSHGPDRRGVRRTAVVAAANTHRHPLRRAAPVKDRAHGAACGLSLNHRVD